MLVESARGLLDDLDFLRFGIGPGLVLVPLELDTLEMVTDTHDRFLSSAPWYNTQRLTSISIVGISVLSTHAHPSLKDG